MNKQTLHGMLLAVITAFAGVPGQAQAAAPSYCGAFTNHYGPFDYRRRAEFNLGIVEQYHYTEKVANGLGGESSYIGADLDYTLQSFPNHTRALATLSMLAARTKSPQLQGANYPTECYFERAVRFAPDDGTAYAAYGNFLNQQGSPARALPLMIKAVELEPENPTFNYNLGLLYLKNKQYDKATKHADKAYALGFPLPGLRNRLAEIRKGGAVEK